MEGFLRERQCQEIQVPKNTLKELEIEKFKQEFRQKRRPRRYPKAQMWPLRTPAL